MLTKEILFGTAIGDALGVPVEFKSRAEVQANPVTDMIGYGTYNLPPGTFSDDSSLMFCLAEAMTKEFNIQNFADNAVKWLYDGYWSARGNVFDVGNVTRLSIARLKAGINPIEAGGVEEGDNGNGALMRILPLVLLTLDKPMEERFELTKQVASVTHGHIISTMACFYYLEFARLIILNGTSNFVIYTDLKRMVGDFFRSLQIEDKYISLFDRLLVDDIAELRQEDIHSSGYVIHTLEASIWSLLKTNSYSEAVLTAVNLGYDTDTTGAVTGGLAALYYGFDSIPKEWINKLARKEDIEDLALNIIY